MTKARDLADLISAGNPLADGAISVSEISDLTATAAELNQLDNTADLPDVRPSLLLDFANSKTLDPRITFTRGSTATYWDGKTTAKAEENLINRSQDFSTVWTFGPTVAAGTISNNNATAPDGTSTAALIQATATTSEHYLQRPSSYYSPVYGQTYTLSCYLKAGTISDVQFVFGNGVDFGSAAYINVDLTAGTITHTASSISASSITDVGSGWYRVTMSAPAIGSNGEGNFITSFVNPSSPTTRLASFTTAGTETYYIWGCQVEQRSSATAYTATTSSPIVKYQPVLQTAASGEARFDHDPVTGESKGLLIEEARTNLVTDSVPDNNWGRGDVILIENAAIAPDGTNTATYFKNDGISEYTSSTQISISSGATVTYSMFLKNIDAAYLRVMFQQGGDFARTWINGSTMEPTGTITYAGSTFSNMVVSYDNIGNGWYRYSLTVDTTGITSHTFFVATSTADNSFTRDTSKSYLYWGAQAEQGSFPTSYIPTSGSTVTRAVEQVTMSNIASELNGQEGTLYVEATPPNYATGDQRLVSIGSSHSNVVEMFREYGSTNFFFAIRHAGTTVSQGSTAWAADTTAKAVIGYKSGDIGFAADGSLIMTNTGTFAGMEMNQMLIGRTFQGGASAWSGEIKKIAIYPKRLPNATLQAMTEA